MCTMTVIDACFEIEKGQMNMEQNTVTKHPAHDTDRQTGREENMHARHRFMKGDRGYYW